MAVPKLLIDGYNVLFQSQLVGRGRGGNWLPAARQRLLQLLSSRLTPAELSTTQLIYDAPQFGPAPLPTTLESGMSVHYAVDHAEADDLLEKIVRTHPTPKLLRVVSSDLRIRRCAQAKRAVSIDSQLFLDQLERRPALFKQPTAPAIEETDEVSSGLSQAEVEYWLDAFQIEDKPK